MSWSKWRDLNPQLPAPKAGRLPIDLHLDIVAAIYRAASPVETTKQSLQTLSMVQASGLEPVSDDYKSPALTN